MKYSRLLTLLMVFTFSPPVFGEPLALSAKQKHQIEAGQVVTQIEEGSDPCKTVTSVGRVAHSVQDVYRLMTDFKNYPRIYNALESATIESADATSVRARFKARLPWPLPARDVTTLTMLEPEQTSFVWRRLNGTIRAYDGRFSAIPCGPNACTVYYSSKIDPGFALLPSWFMTWGQSYVLPSIIYAIRDTLGRRSGPYWQPGVDRPPFSREPSP